MNDQLTDRIKGVLVGAATGDALGAPVEFTHPEPGTLVLEMTGGGVFNWAPGEWTDDTSMTLAVAQAAAHHRDISTGAGLNKVAAGFKQWYDSQPPDVGSQTASVLRHPTRKAKKMTANADNIYGRKAGNGSLMRTSPVALATLHDSDIALIRTASAVNDLTHNDPDARIACSLWSFAIRHVIHYGSFEGAHMFIDLFLTTTEQARWRTIMREAENGIMPEGGSNGWVIGALAAAWWAVSSSDSFEETMWMAILEGGDTDTVACIAGALAGAKYGASAIPARWRAALHGYPGITGVELEDLALRAAGVAPLAGII